MNLKGGVGNFNPRAPYGARHVPPLASARTLKFQSTRPLRGATSWDAFSVRGDSISIHAPLTGRDNADKISAVAEFDFNPRAPYGARLEQAGIFGIMFDISIHAPLTGRDYNL